MSVSIACSASARLGLFTADEGADLALVTFLVVLLTNRPEAVGAFAVVVDVRYADALFADRCSRQTFDMYR